MRYTQHFYLRNASFRDEYIRRHDELWPEMKELLFQAGFRNYSIWISGNNLFAYFENDNLTVAEKLLKNSPVKAKWDKYMAEIITIDPTSQSLECAFLYEG